jgi:hypothetical protein
MGYIGNGPYQGVLTGGNIQDGTVETTDLADGAITTVKINDGAVTAAKLASGAAVPDQSGQSGKYLTTDGSTASWGTVDLSSKVDKTGDTMTGALAITSATSSTSTDALDLRQPSNGGGLGSEALQSRILIGGSTRYSKIIGTHNQYYDTLSSLEFHTSSGSGITKKMRIDGEGRVTMPYQPAFHATANGTSQGGSGQRAYPDVVTNKGNCFSSNVFTAPVTGTYVFMAHALHDQDTSYIRFRINGTEVTAMGYMANFEEATDIHGIYTLAAGDTVDVYSNKDTEGGIHGFFSGYLLG